MQLGKLTLLAFFLGIIGCSERADVITGRPPFLNQRCEYENVNELIRIANEFGASNELMVTVRLDDAPLGIFSILLWKKDFNVVIAGVPHSKLLYYSALKRGIENNADIILAMRIKDALPMTCASA